MSSNALVPINDMERMAQAFAKGGLFGTKTPDQCLSLLLLAQAEGQHPALAMRDFDVIQGRPAKKAEAMLRSFIAAGGAVEWHEMTDNKADASFMHPQGSNGKWVRIDWDMARAKKAGLGGRDMYSKYGRQMLSNRVISEGCRRVYPAATSGLYVPEEVRTFAKEERKQEKDMGAAEVVPDADDDALKTLEKSPEEIIAEANARFTPPSEFRTRTTILNELCAQSGMNLQTILNRAQVTSAEEMSDDDYNEVSAMLRRKVLKKQSEAMADRANP